MSNPICETNGVRLDVITEDLIVLLYHITIVILWKKQWNTIH